MECNKVQEMIPFYSDSSLEPQDEAHVRDHLIVCSGCRREYEEIRALTGMVRDVFAKNAVETVPGYLGIVRNKILVKKRSRSVYYRVASVAAVIMMIVSSFLYGYLHSGSGTTPDQLARVVDKSISVNVEETLNPLEFSLFELNELIDSEHAITDEEIADALFADTMVDFSSHDIINMIEEEDLSVVLVSYGSGDK